MHKSRPAKIVPQLLAGGWDGCTHWSGRVLRRLGGLLRRLRCALGHHPLEGLLAEAL